MGKHAILSVTRPMAHTQTKPDRLTQKVVASPGSGDGATLSNQPLGAVCFWLLDTPLRELWGPGGRTALRDVVMVGNIFTKAKHLK